MRNFFESAGWNTLVIVILGLVSLATKEIVTFAMLGFVIIILSNIYDVLKEISVKLNTDK